MIIKPHFEFPKSLSKLLSDHNVFKIRGRDGTTFYCIRYEIPERLKSVALGFLTTFDKGGAFVFFDPIDKTTVKVRGYAKGNLVLHPNGSDVYELEIVFLQRERRNLVTWFFGAMGAVVFANLPAWVKMLQDNGKTEWYLLALGILAALGSLAIIVEFSMSAVGRFLNFVRARTKGKDCPDSRNVADS